MLQSYDLHFLLLIIEINYIFKNILIYWEAV